MSRSSVVRNSTTNSYHVTQGITNTTSLGMLPLKDNSTIIHKKRQQEQPHQQQTEWSSKMKSPNS